MRSGDVFVDAATQSRLMTMPRLRPAAWAHARPGVVRTDGSGNISSIATGMEFTFSQSSAGNRPSVATTAGRPVIRSTSSLQLSTNTAYFPSGSTFECSLVVMWWSRASEGPIAYIDDLFLNEFVRVDYNTTPQAIGSYAGTTQVVTIANDRPYVASIRADGSNPATFRVGDSSQTISSSYSTEDSAAYLSGNCDYFEVAVFLRQLSAHETTLAEAIMAWSNGLPNALGGAHPFRNRPPLIGD
jgi:hypothetical protein